MRSRNARSRTSISTGLWCPFPLSGIDSYGGILTIPGYWRTPCGQSSGVKLWSGRGCATRSCDGLSTDKIEQIAGGTTPIVSQQRHALGANTLRWSMM